MSAVKILSVAAVIVASVALAVFVVSRLDDAAVQTIVAIACGAVASIPVAFGLLLALVREPATPHDESETPAPRIIIVERNPQPLRGDWKVSRIPTESEKPSALAKRDDTDWDA